MKILIVKTSSLGDVIHTLPAITDLAKAHPEAVIDWLVEPGFKEVPSWHPAIRKVITIPFRDWRKSGLLKSIKSGEVSKTIKEIQGETYDKVIDAQGLIKSAIFSRFAVGTRIGLNLKSAREPLASMFYHQKLHVPKGEHAVHRTRTLFSKAFGYRFDPKEVDYGLNLDNKNQVSGKTDPYCVFLHGTTWGTKHWPEAYWLELARKVTYLGIGVKMFWGNEEEKQRAEWIAKKNPNVIVLPKMTITEIAGVLYQAIGVVSVDTGLAHLAAALNVPNITLYGPTSPILAGTYGRQQFHLKSEMTCSPCLKRVCHKKSVSNIHPPCFGFLNPERVFSFMKKQLNLEPVKPEYSYDPV